MSLDYSAKKGRKELDIKLRKVLADSIIIGREKGAEKLNAEVFYKESSKKIASTFNPIKKEDSKKLVALKQALIASEKNCEATKELGQAF